MKKLIALTVLSLCSAVHAQAAPDAQADLARADKAAARAMAERKFDDFARLVDDEAVFFHMGQVAKGKAAVLDFARPLFAGAQAPFSYETAESTVLPSGLAMTSGPVRAAPDDRVVARFNTVWRRSADGAWKIVFDRSWPASQ